MASRIVPSVPELRDRPEFQPPPLDTVLLWLTPTVEEDYEERSVFPSCRNSSAVAWRVGGAMLHFLRIDEAEALLRDAVERRETACGGVKVAYNYHVDNLREGIEAAQGRPARFTAPRPVLVWNRWCGTREQIQAELGIPENADFPGPGRRWTLSKDRLGSPVRIARDEGIWPNQYSARVSDSVERSSAPASKDAGEPAAVPQRVMEEKEQLAKLRALPATRDAFRHDTAEVFWSYVKLFVQIHAQPREGYALSDDAVQEFFDTASDAYWFLKQADTTGSSPKAKLQKVLAAHASADQALQRFLGGLRPHQGEGP